MSKTFTCIICPNSCKLEIQKSGDGYAVTGNLCKRGEVFAIGELTCPKRTLTTTVKTAFSELPFVPVKTARPVDKDKLFALMNALSHVVVTQKIKTGDIVLQNIYGTDVVCSCDMTLEYGSCK
jgi:CxxC motif-containing protein